MTTPSGGLATQYAPPLDLPFRFMATALGWLGVLAVVYPWHTPLLLGSFYDPHLLTFVHVNTLGVIAATDFRRQLPDAAGGTGSPDCLCAPGAFVLVVVSAVAAAVPGRPVAGLARATGARRHAPVRRRRPVRRHRSGHPFRAPYRDVVFWHLLTSVIGLALAASLGLLLALSKHVGFLGALTLPILAAHATLMLGAWVAPLLMGVAYRLVGMFTLTEDRLHASWAWAGLACTAGGACLLATGVLAFDRRIELVGALGLLAGVSLFAAQLLHLYQVRRRHQFDVHIPFVLAAAAFGVSAVALLLLGLLAGRTASDPIWVGAGWLAIAGWAETAIQGFLYKIGTFLTWLHRYAPLAGRQPVPRLEDLYDRATAMCGWAAWTIGVALGAAAALTQLDLLAHLASAGLSMGAGLFLLNAVRVGAHWRAARPSIHPNPDAAVAARH